MCWRHGTWPSGCDGSASSARTRSFTYNYFDCKLLTYNNFTQDPLRRPGNAVSYKRPTTLSSMSWSTRGSTQHYSRCPLGCWTSPSRRSCRGQRHMLTRGSGGRVCRCGRMLDVETETGLEAWGAAASVPLVNTSNPEHKLPICCSVALI